MSDPYVGEIRMFTYADWVPEGWLPCDGTLYSFNQYQLLGAMLSNIYGGDGRTTFAVPNLTGQAVVGVNGGDLAMATGAKMVTLQTPNIPTHSHIMRRNVNADGYNGKTSAPDAKSTLGGYQTMTGSTATNIKAFNTTASNPVSLMSQTVGAWPASTSAVAPHNNLQPYQVFWFAIAWSGIFPSPD